MTSCSAARPDLAGTTIDLTNLGTAGFVIQGDTAGDKAGWGVASAGDVNGDGITDLIVGAPNGDDSDLNAGEAYVIFGSTSVPRRRDHRPDRSRQRRVA